MTLGTPTILTSGSGVVVGGVNNVVFSNITISPGSGVVLFIDTSDGVTPNSISGMNLTWKKVVERIRTSSYALSIWIGYGASPTTDDIVVDQPGTGPIGWSVSEITGVKSGDFSNSNLISSTNSGVTTDSGGTLPNTLQSNSGVYAAAVTGYGVTDNWNSPMVRVTAAILNTSSWGTDGFAPSPGTLTPSVTWSTAALQAGYLLFCAFEVLAAAGGGGSSTNGYLPACGVGN